MKSKIVTRFGICESTKEEKRVVHEMSDHLLDPFCNLSKGTELSVKDKWQRDANLLWEGLDDPEEQGCSK